MSTPIGVITRAYREKNNLSLGQFAKRCGVSKSYVYALENGKTSGELPSPTLESLCGIADAMDMPLLQLLSKMGLIDASTISSDAKKEETEQDGSDIEPFEYIPLTNENLRSALSEGRLLILPYRAPRKGQDVFIPIYEDDGLVIMNSVTAVYGGVYEATSEALGSVLFTLLDINKKVFLNRKDAYAKLKEWKGRTQKPRMSATSIPRTWSDTRMEYTKESD